MADKVINKLDERVVSSTTAQIIHRELKKHLLDHAQQYLESA
jgi:6-phosphogluconolactonase/glucosamine-6-phosphate isomerase/deaminase